MIISGGVNIYPQEAENVLTMHPKVADVAVFGVPNDEFGEEVKAVVQPVDMADAGPALERELIAYCRSQLAHLKCPRSVDFEAELPRHPTGKLYKRLLKDRYWAGHDSADRLVQPGPQQQCLGPQPPAFDRRRPRRPAGRGRRPPRRSGPR